MVSIYLVLAVTVFNRKPENQVCKGMELVVKDSIDYGFITEAEVTKLLKQKKLYPGEKRIGTINVRQLEETLSQHPFISRAECYLTSGGKVGVEIYQRIPLLRVMSSNGDNYYIRSCRKNYECHREADSCSCCHRIYRPEVCSARIIRTRTIPTAQPVLGRHKLSR